MNSSVRFLAVSCLVAVAAALASPSEALAQRQYYDNSWYYNEVNSYHYCKYYYYPTATSTTYSYHYVIYYPSTPTYYYYYNPGRRYYWGRFEVDEKGKAKGYSLLEEKDRKGKLTDIDEKAFPKPGEMPSIPESADNVKMEKPPVDLPKDTKNTKVPDSK